MGLFSFFKRKSEKQQFVSEKPESYQELSDDTVIAAAPDETKGTAQNTYDSLRDAALHVSPEQLGLNLPDDQTVVYGVVFDWEMGIATATTVAYQTGDASLYISSGAGVIGGGQHQKVSTAAKQFVQLAQDSLPQTEKTTSTDLPGTDEVKFYLLTNKGIFAGREQMINFENGSSSWISLFTAGNQVLTTLRETSKNQS